MNQTSFVSVRLTLVRKKKITIFLLPFGGIIAMPCYLKNAISKKVFIEKKKKEIHFDIETR